MKILEALTEYGTRSLDRTFSYLYNGSRPIGPRFRIKIDFHGRLVMGFILSSEETSKSVEELSEEKGYPLKMIQEEDIVDIEPLIDENMFLLAKKVASYYCSPLISVIQTMLPITLSPKTSSLHGPKIAYEKYLEILDKNTLEDKVKADNDSRVFIACRVDGVRLIDNICLGGEENA